MLIKSKKAARIGEKVLALFAVLVAFGLAVLISVIDSPAKESGIETCDYGNCPIRIGINQLWNFWLR